MGAGFCDGARGTCAKPATAARSWMKLPETDALVVSWYITCQELELLFWEVDMVAPVSKGGGWAW